MTKASKQIIQNIAFLYDKLTEIEDQGDQPKSIAFLKSEIDIQKEALLKIECEQYYQGEN